MYISQLVLLQLSVLLSVDLLDSTDHQAEEEKVHLNMVYLRVNRCNMVHLNIFDQKCKNRCLCTP